MKITIGISIFRETIHEIIEQKITALVGISESFVTNSNVITKTNCFKIGFYRRRRIGEVRDDLSAIARRIFIHLKFWAEIWVFWG